MKELRNLWNSFTKFDKVYTILFTVSLIAVQLITDSTLVSLVCAILGIGHVILVRKGHRYAMVLGAVQSLLYCIISFNAKIYGDFMLNLYNVVFLSYGFIQWSNNTKDNQLALARLTKRDMLALFDIVATVYVGVLIVLQLVGGFNPYLDATTTTLCIIGVFLMSKRYIECWIALSLNNIISVVLWTVFWLKGNSNAPVMMFMFGCYLINSVYAHKQWSDQLKE